MSAQDEETVQVPASVLNSLLTNVNKLRDSVSQLRSENDSLKEELKVVKADLCTLQRNSGVRFPQFTKLPVELRRFVFLLVPRDSS
jgi:cell division protein FtsB